jgi:tetratricopeptide (TPR) repeat protein
MIQKKCPICTKVKGKRGCLRNANTLICSQCCAQIRNADCEGCSYYKEAEKFNLEKAKKSPQHFVARIDPDVDEKINQALSMLQLGNMSSCERILNSLAEENSDLYTFHFAMGTFYGFKGQYAQAMESFTKSLDIYPYYVDCWFNRAMAAQKALDVPELVFSLRKVIEFGEPSDSTTIDAKDLLKGLAQAAREENGLELDVYVENMQLFNEAFVLMQNEKWQAAIEKFKQVISVTSRNPSPFGNLGICYMRLGENERAIQMFDEAVAIDPNYEPAIINREILKKRIAEGILEASDLKVKSVNYSAEYSVKKDTLLIDDYLNGKL